MKYKLRYLPLALKDLESIGDYLNMFYPKTMRTFLSVPEKKAQALSEYPIMYELYGHNNFYRRMLIDKYSLFYQVNEENSSINVYRILRTSWEVNRFLTKNN